MRGERRTGRSALVPLNAAGARRPRAHRRLGAGGQIIDGAREVLKESRAADNEDLIDLFRLVHLFPFFTVETVCLLLPFVFK